MSEKNIKSPTSIKSAQDNQSQNTNQNRHENKSNARPSKPYTKSGRPR